MGNTAARAVRQYPKAPPTSSPSPPTASAPTPGAAHANPTQTTSRVSGTSSGAGAAEAQSHTESDAQHQDAPLLKVNATRLANLATQQPPTVAEELTQHTKIVDMLKQIEIKSTPLPTQPSGVEHRVGPLKSFPQLSREAHGPAIVEEVPGRLTTFQVIRLLDMHSKGASTATLAQRFALPVKDVEAVVKHFVSPWKLVPSAQTPDTTADPKK